MNLDATENRVYLGPADAVEGATELICACGRERQRWLDEVEG